MDELFLPHVTKGVVNLELLAKQVVEGFLTGLHKSPFHGFSVEFAEHRPYNQGEDTHHIDWKLFARTDRLYTKRFTEETNLRCHILIDTSSSMYFPYKSDVPNKLRFSVCAAAALTYLLYKQRDAVSLSTFSSDIDFASPCRSGFSHTHHLFTQLERMYEKDGEEILNKTTDIVPALHLLAEKISKRSMVIIFSDMLDGENALESTNNLFQSLQHLRYRQDEVLLFNVQSRKKEEKLEYSNRPYRFVDMESGKEVKINPQHIQKTYVEAIGAWKENLKRNCEQYRIDFIPSYIEDGFNPILQTYLSKRKIKL